MNTFTIGLLQDGKPADHYLMAWGQCQGHLTMTHLDENMDVERVRSLGLDLIVDCRLQRSQGAYLGAARLGLLALDCSSGFWETYHRLPQTRFAIRHHTPEHPEGRTVLGGAYATKYLFHLNRAHVRRKALAHLRTLLHRVAATGTMPAPAAGDARLARAAPGPAQRLVYFAKMAHRVGKRAGYRLLNVRPKWGLSVSQAGWRQAQLLPGTTLSAPRGHFWADPFLHQHQGRTFCFVEDFVYRTGRAHIAVLELTSSGATEIGSCIREKFHLSFPFLFTYQGVLYMCPESSAARQVRIYRCTAFPLQWELCHVAMDGVSAADSMFFFREGTWWLMTSIDDSGAGDHCSELYLFSGASPFETNWIPHPQNPIRIDPDGGRNAGLIIEGGKLFRGAQRQGFDQYGAGLLLYEIVEISQQVYRERLVSEIGCAAQPGLLGVHHLSTTGSISVVDHLRRRVFP